MMHDTWLQVIILGIVEGLTEFLPISSTGHLILAERILHFEGPPGHVFDIVIQLGAIIAVVVGFFPRLWNVLIGLPTSAEARRFAIAVIVAFLPAAVIGVLLHRIIKEVLFSPWVVAVSLIVGGIAMLVIERVRPAPRVESVERFPLLTAIGIGFAQCLAMIPGVSRSGATIMGALLLGVERRAAAEFSFFLAIPTMLGATVYDLWKNRATLSLDGGAMIALGFVVAFIVAMPIVRGLVAFVGRHGLIPFAWYRIAAGTIALAALFLTR